MNRKREKLRAKQAMRPSAPPSLTSTQDSKHQEPSVLPRNPKSSGLAPLRLQAIHEVLHSELSKWSSDTYAEIPSPQYETLQCYEMLPEYDNSQTRNSLYAAQTEGNTQDIDNEIED